MRVSDEGQSISGRPAAELVLRDKGLSPGITMGYVLWSPAYLGLPEHTRGPAEPILAWCSRVSRGASCGLQGCGSCHRAQLRMASLSQGGWHRRARPSVRAERLDPLQQQTAGVPQGYAAGGAVPGRSTRQQPRSPRTPSSSPRHPQPGSPRTSQP